MIVLRLLLAGLILLLLTGCASIDRIVYPVQPPGYKAHQADVELLTEDELRLKANYWHASTNRWTLLMSHGNAEDIGYMAPFFSWLHEQGLNVFAYDYRGYGHSEGIPSETGTYRDISAAWAYLVVEQGVAPESIILFGRSLGSGPSTWLAAQKPCGGLIIESGFTTIFQAVLPRLWYPGDRYRNISRIDEINCPLLLVHGANDRLFKPVHPRRLYARAREPKTLALVSGAGHNDVIAQGTDDYIQRIHDWLDTIDAPK